MTPEQETEVRHRLAAIGTWCINAIVGRCTLEEAHHAVGELHLACHEFLRGGTAD